MDKGRHVLSDLALNVIEKVPDVVDATLEGKHRDAKLPGTEEVQHATSTGLQQVKSSAAQAQRRARRSAQKSSGGHSWKRGVFFLMFVLAVGVLVNRMLRN